MFETAVDLLEEVIGCDGGRSGEVRAGGAAGLPSAVLSPAQLVNRMATTERLIQALQAEQARDMAAFVEKRMAVDKRAGLEGRLQGRTIGTEVGLALGIATQTADSRVLRAVWAVDRHPRLLALCGSGRVSLAGLSKAMKHTQVLDPAVCRAVDAELAVDVCDDRLTPGRLERAAIRRTLAADPDGAAKRADAARADKRVTLSDTVDGTAAVVSRLPAEQAVAVYESLDSRARALRTAGDERSLAELMCDLLVEDVTGHRLVPDPDPWDDTVPDRIRMTTSHRPGRHGRARDGCRCASRCRS